MLRSIVSLLRGAAMVSKPFGIFDRQIEPAWLLFGRWCSYAAFPVIVIMIFLPSPSYAQSSGKDGDPTAGFIYIGLLLALYFLPSIIAGYRKHRNRGAIKALNLLLGWTVVGWVAALVWSFTADTEDKPPLSVPVGGLLETSTGGEKKERGAEGANAD